MNNKEYEAAKRLIDIPDVKKGSYSFIGDSNITYADIKILLDYIKQLEQEYQKQKEAIDKAIDKLYCWGEALNPDFQKEMLDILKEVEI